MDMYMRGFVVLISHKGGVYDVIGLVGVNFSILTADLKL